MGIENFGLEKGGASDFLGKRPAMSDKYVPYIPDELRVDARSYHSYEIADLVLDLRKYPIMSPPQYAADRLDTISRLWERLRPLLDGEIGDDRAIDLMEYMDATVFPVATTAGVTNE